jgi:nifR3 family TIM-barrel protein
MFRIRDVAVDPPLVLAPIAGHTDSLFRQAIKGLGGCGLVVSELVSTEGMTRNRGAAEGLTRFEESERPVSIQIFGSDSARMADSAAMVEAMGADIVDVNLGCPVKKVVKQGGGSNLLRDLPRMGKILRAVREAVRIPLTIKIRSGWDRDSINAVEVVQIAQDAGVEAVTIHGRTRSDMFSGHSDWGIIARVKERARIPVIGNGDVFAPSDAERMFRETGVDGIMIGRGVLSNPWLIRQCWDHLNGKAVKQVSTEEKAAFMDDFLRRVSRQVPPPMALGKLKKIAGYLSRGFPEGGELRARLHASRTISEFFDVLGEYVQSKIAGLDSSERESAQAPG